MELKCIPGDSCYICNYEKRQIVRATILQVTIEKDNKNINKKYKTYTNEEYPEDLIFVSRVEAERHLHQFIEGMNKLGDINARK